MLPVLGPQLLRLTFGQLVAQQAKGKALSAAFNAMLALLPSGEEE